MTLSLIVTGAAIVVFGIFYAIVYRITSNAYYSNVAERSRDYEEMSCMLYGADTASFLERLRRRKSQRGP